MRGSIILSALAVAAACAPPLRAADRAQEVSRHPATARVSAGGVTVDLAAGDERNWLGALPEGLMPVVATIRNESGGTIRIRPEQFVLALPGGVRKPAMEPGRVARELLSRLQPVSQAPAERSALAMLYAWPGLHGIGSVAPLDDRLRPDPRPRPEGPLVSGASGSTVLIFEADAARLKRFAVEVEIEGEGGEVLGTASAPFTR